MFHGLLKLVQHQDRWSLSSTDHLYDIFHRQERRSVHLCLFSLIIAKKSTSSKTKKIKIKKTYKKGLNKTENHRIIKND